jgi:hypothetical protein
MARFRALGVAAAGVAVAATVLVVVRTQTPARSTVRGVEWAGEPVPGATPSPPPSLVLSTN